MVWLIVPRPKSKLLAIFSIALVVMNFLTLRYLAMDDVDQADLAMVAGHSVILDPGHGGIDSGASSNQAVEKEITLSIALKVGEILRNHGAHVFFTRSSDMDYYTRGKGGKRNDLIKRTAMIEEAGAEMFVSIHCNAIRLEGQFGAQVFYNPKLEENKELALIMQRALRDFPNGNKRQAKEDLHILLLKEVSIPGVLVETGYLTKKEEARRLSDAAYQQKMAEQIAKGLAYHFSQKVER